MSAGQGFPSRLTPNPRIEVPNRVACRSQIAARPLPGRAGLSDDGCLVARRPILGVLLLPSFDAPFNGAMVRVAMYFMKVLFECASTTL